VVVVVKEGNDFVISHHLYNKNNNTNTTPHNNNTLSLHPTTLLPRHKLTQLHIELTRARIGNCFGCCYPYRVHSRIGFVLLFLFFYPSLHFALEAQSFLWLLCGEVDVEVIELRIIDNLNQR